MGRYEYLSDSEWNGKWGDMRDDYYMFNYPLTTPRVVIKTETQVITKSPYIDTTTNTWWQYDDTLQQYVNTGVAAQVDPTQAEETQVINIVNETISDMENIVNEDEALTLEEIETLTPNN